MIRIIGSPEEGLIFSTIRNSESHGMHVMAPPAMLVNRELAEIYIVLSGGSGLLQEGGSIDNIDSAKIFIDRAVLTELHVKRYINPPFDFGSFFENSASINLK